MLARITYPRNALSMAVFWGILGMLMGVKNMMFLRGKSWFFLVPAFAAVFISFLVFPEGSRAGIQDDINAKEQQIQEIQRRIDEIQAQLDQSQTKSATLEGEIKKLNAQINQITLEIQSLRYSIDQTGLEITDTQDKIGDAEDKLDTHKAALGRYLQLTYETDQRNLTEVLLLHSTLSEFFNDLNSLQVTQLNIKNTIVAIEQLKAELDDRKQTLEDKKADLEKLKRLQEIAKNSLSSNKTTKTQLLKETKGQESKYQEIIKKSKLDIERIRSQITYLAQNGVSAEDAVKYGQLAAIGAGIRPAFLIAELEQESALGSNVGKCYITSATSGATRRITNGQVYPKGIHPTRDLPLFLTITAELGKDPFQTPVSCGSSWGGAMGPAQFIPSTWMGYRAEVTRLTGHTLPNPWNIEDAFVAAAAKLSRDGASSKTRAGEIAASKRYYCGNATSTKSGCVNYANSVQRLATEIEKSL